MWRRGGQGGRGRGFPERDGGSQRDKENRGRGFYGNEGGERKNHDIEKREKIMWGTEREYERSNNGGKTHEMDDAGKLVGRCTEFCPLEEKRMRTKERLLHR